MTPISDDMVERASRAIDDFEMPDGDPFGVLIFNSDYILPASMADMVEHKSQITRSIARAALTAALEGSVAVPAWQPIETAPKDGFEIDLWCLNITDGAETRFAGMFWNESERWEDWQSYILEMKWRPTHWAPVPAGPIPRQERLAPEPDTGGEA